MENQIEQEINFDDLTEIQVPFTYRGVKYVMCEATEDASRRYENEMMSRCTIGPDGKTPSGFRDLRDLESILVASCTFPKEEMSKPLAERKCLDVATVRTWNATKVVQPLAKRLKEISELSKTKDIKGSLKNVPAATEGG